VVLPQLPAKVAFRIISNVRKSRDGMSSTSVTIRMLLVACVIGAAAMSACAHPLDTLSADEITVVRSTLEREGKADGQTRYPFISLREPNKQTVRTYKPGDAYTREAQAVVKKGRQTYEAVIDLQNRRLESWVLKADVQPSILAEEWELAQKLTKRNAQWQYQVKVRGITDLDAIFCDAYTVGYFGQKEATARLVNVPCFVTNSDSNNLYAQPVEGLYGIVDLDAKSVIDIVDTGSVGKINSQRVAGKDISKFALRDNLQNSISDLKVNDSILSWNRWSFHIGLDRRSGLIVSLVKVLDKGTIRDFLYRGSISELFVPYMDGALGWSSRTFMDVGEYGLGRLTSILVPGVDCPTRAIFLDAVLPSEKGIPVRAENAICIFEHETDAPLYRHYESLNKTFVGKTARELVVRTIYTIGNYDYISDWVFTENGELELRIGATGYPAVKGSTTGTDSSGGAPQHGGANVEHGLSAVDHDHFLSVRLDVDVDGPNNTLLKQRLVTTALPGSNERRSVWSRSEENVSVEGGFRSTEANTWQLINPSNPTSLGNAPAIVIAGDSASLLLDAEDWPAKRAAFAARQVWATRYKPTELYASGDYPNQSNGSDGLNTYANEQPLINTDIVIWYTLGFHHVTRPEDWPIQSTVWKSVRLRPAAFFDSNPGLPQGSIK
jgi:primary-amine oxidase